MKKKIQYVWVFCHVRISYLQFGCDLRQNFMHTVMRLSTADLICNNIYQIGEVSKEACRKWPSRLIINSQERRSWDIKIIWFMETGASPFPVGYHPWTRRSLRCCGINYEPVSQSGKHHSYEFLLQMMLFLIHKICTSSFFLRTSGSRVWPLFPSLLFWSI